MLPYLALSVFPIILAFFFGQADTNEKQKKAYFIICAVVIIAFLGLRDKGVGNADTVNYYNRMREAIYTPQIKKFLDSYDTVEKGYAIFVWLLARVFKNPQWLIVVSATIYVTCLFVFIYNESENVSMSVFLYITLGVMMFHMQGLRQSIAMSICLIAYMQAKRHKFVPFILLVILAMQFHTSAFVFFVIYPMCAIKVTAAKTILVGVISCLMFVFATKIISIAGMLFERSYSDTVQSGGVVTVLVYLIVLALSVTCNTHINSNNEKYPVFYMLILGLSFFLMRYFGIRMAERVHYYFAYSQIILLPNTVNCFKDEKIKVLLNTAIVIMAIALYAYRLRGSAFIPYIFFFN